MPRGREGPKTETCSLSIYDTIRLPVITVPYDIRCLCSIYISFCDRFPCEKDAQLTPLYFKACYSCRLRLVNTLVHNLPSGFGKKRTCYHV